MKRKIALLAPMEEYLSLKTAHKVMRICEKARNKIKTSSNSICKKLFIQADEISENIHNNLPHLPTISVSGTCHVMNSYKVPVPTQKDTQKLRKNHCTMQKRKSTKIKEKSVKLFSAVIILLACFTYELYLSSDHIKEQASLLPSILLGAEASLIVGDSAIEIQEVEPRENKEPASNAHHHEIHQTQHQANQQPNQVIFGSSNGAIASLGSHLIQVAQRAQHSPNRHDFIQMPAPLPPLESEDSSKGKEDITDGDRKSRQGHDYDINDFNFSNKHSEKNAVDKVPSAPKVQPSQQEQQVNDLDDDSHKTIAGKVVDFELTPAGGHNKAKIKMKKKKKKEDEMYKKWGKKKMAEKKAIDLEHKEHMKKKKAEGHKGKKKWGKEVHGMKKKGKFKKKKWGKKVKKGKGIKKGKKGRKFLKDVGHKDTGFKTVYHKEEWGKSSKWHDIKRQKKWDQKDKKWKKKWNKEKGKKYKGDHLKKFEKKKGAGKKYKKENKEKFKKFKKEKFEKGKKKKMEEKGKRKEGGLKKEKKEMKKKKKKE